MIDFDQFLKTLHLVDTDMASTIYGLYKMQYLEENYKEDLHGTSNSDDGAILAIRDT